MKKRAQAVQASAVLAAGSMATLMAAEPPLQTLPSQQEIWITGTVLRSAGQFLSGNQTTLQLDRRTISPCNGHVMTAVVRDKAGPAEPSFLQSRWGQGYSSFSCLYGPDAFCKLLVRDVKTVCMHVYGLPDGQMPKHARSLDEIRASRP